MTIPSYLKAPIFILCCSLSITASKSTIPWDADDESSSVSSSHGIPEDNADETISDVNWDVFYATLTDSMMNICTPAHNACKELENWKDLSNYWTSRGMSCQVHFEPLTALLSGLNTQIADLLAKYDIQAYLTGLLMEDEEEPNLMETGDSLAALSVPEVEDFFLSEELSRIRGLGHPPEPPKSAFFQELTFQELTEGIQNEPSENTDLDQLKTAAERLKELALEAQESFRSFVQNLMPQALVKTWNNTSLIMQALDSTLQPLPFYLHAPRPLSWKHDMIVDIAWPADLQVMGIQNFPMLEPFLPPDTQIYGILGR